MLHTVYVGHPLAQNRFDGQHRNGLVTRACPLSKLVNRDVPVYRKGRRFTPAEESFVELLRTHCRKLSRE